MKVMDSRPGQGANRSDSRSYREDLQRRHGCEGALSCFDISGLPYQGLVRQVGTAVELSGSAFGIGAG